MNQTIVRVSSGCFIIFFVLLFSGVLPSFSQDIPVKLVPIPHPPLDNLEKEIFDQLTEGRESMEKRIANPELDSVNRALAYGDLGHLYHTYDFNDAAEACYFNAVQMEPRVYRWNYCMGFVLQEKGEFEKALEYYKKARAIQVTADLVYLVNIRIGDCYKDLNQLDNAGYAYELAEDIFPDGANILSRLGELALARNQYEQAIALLTKALEKAPEANKLHYPLAMAYRRVGKTDLAREHLAMHGKVGLHPPDPLIDKLRSLKKGSRVHTLEGKTAFSANRYEEAVLSFQKAVDANPSDSAARVNLGTAYVYLKDYQKGLENFEKALELDPDNMTAHYNLGEISIYTGDFKKAIEELSLFTKAHPDDAEAHQMLATAFRYNGQPDKALMHYKQAIKLNSTMVDSWLDLSLLLFAGSYQYEAIQVLEQAHATLPHSIEISHQLARYLCMAPDIRLRDEKKASELALKIFDAAPDYNIAKTVAIAFAGLDQCDKAVEWIKTSIRLAQESKQDDQVLQMLNRNLEYFNQNQPCKLP